MRKLIATTASSSIALVLWPAAWPRPPTRPRTPAYVPGQLLVRFDGGDEQVLKLPAGRRRLHRRAGARRQSRRSPTRCPTTSRTPRPSPMTPAPPVSPAAGSGRSGTSCPAGRSAASPPPRSSSRSAAGSTPRRPGTSSSSAASPAGKGARVAVLDTGVAYLTKKPKFRRSPDFSRKQFLPGYDFVDKDRMPLDEDGHGTHVTGTIAERDRQPLRPHRPRLEGEDHPRPRARLRGLRHRAEHRQGDSLGRQPQGPGDQHELRVLARREQLRRRSRGSARRSSTRSRRARWWSRRPETRTASPSPTRPAPRT